MVANCRQEETNPVKFKSRTVLPPKFLLSSSALRIPDDGGVRKWEPVDGERKFCFDFEPNAMGFGASDPAANAVSAPPVHDSLIGAALSPEETMPALEEPPPV